MERPVFRLCTALEKSSLPWMPAGVAGAFACPVVGCRCQGPMQYRSDIDGLRAVAVVPVILFHAGFAGFEGGFVGVDVFFVISGYLITGILIGELATGTFSIARFYERRARRILPALFVVMAACLPFAWLWMLPSQMKEFGQSIVATLLFSSNVLFWRQDDYFSASAELQPLLHTWSLSVEEQFYLIFPILLLVLWRFGRRQALISLVILAVLSFLVSEWASHRLPTANFFLAPMRAWELLAGAICAMVSARRPFGSSSVLSIAGLAMIIGAILVFDGDTPFPGVYALVPVTGAALILLFAGHDSLTARLLSRAPLVGLGLISYSAYLWHQPLFAFARIRSLTEPEPALMAALSGLSIVLAYLTWRFVERPFRSGGAWGAASRRGVFVSAGAAGGLFWGLALALTAQNGLEGRFAPEVLRLAGARSDHQLSECNFSKGLPAHPQAQCLHPGPDGSVSVLLLGDSHSAALSKDVSAALASGGIGVYRASYSACLPLRDFQRNGQDPQADCAQFLDDVLSFADAAGIETIVLSARFPLYLHGEGFDNGEGGVETRRDTRVDVLGAAQTEEAGGPGSSCKDRVLAAFEDRLLTLAERFTLVLVNPIPEAGWDVPQLAAKRRLYGHPDLPVTTSWQAYRARAGQISDLFARLASEEAEIQVAPVDQALCDTATGRCVNADARGVYYFDDDHLSRDGARRVTPVVLAAIHRSLDGNRSRQAFAINGG